MILNKIQPKILLKTQDKIMGVLGNELQANWDSSKGLAGWAATLSATIEAVNDGGIHAVKITSTTSNGGGTLAVSGLTVGLTYRLIIRARRGAQGTTQQLRSLTWSTTEPIPLKTIDTDTYADYSIDVLASETSGANNFRSSFGGSIGDEIYISEISIREVL